MRITQPSSQINRADQRGDSRSDVNHGPAREVERREISAQRRIQQTSLAPDHMGHRVINKNGPKHHKQHHSAELHAFGECACNQCRGNDGKHQLVDHEGLLWNG